MAQNNRNCEEAEIDISKYIAMFVKRKSTFFAVFLLVVILGVAKAQFSPQIYSISMLVQPPTIGELEFGEKEPVTAESLQGLIVSGAFNEAVGKKMNVDPNAAVFGFTAAIPDKTSFLLISVERDSTTKETAPDLLRNLCEAISLRYQEYIDARINELDHEIRQNERLIANAGERIKGLQARIMEITERARALKEEIKAVNNNMAQLSAERERSLKDPAATESVYTLLLVNYFQNSSGYLMQANSQLIDLSGRRADLELEIRDIEVQINDYQAEAGRVKAKKDLVSNLKIIAQPKISPDPINPGKKRAAAVSIVLGLFIGLLAVVLQEFRVNTVMKRSVQK